MRLRLKTGNATRDVAAGKLWAAAGTADFTLDLGGAALGPGLVNAHDHLHRNHLPRIEHDTGDLVTRAVVAASHEVRPLRLDGDGCAFARFDGITLSRRASSWMGPAALATMAKRSDYFWHGYVGNLALRDLHDRLFPDGPRYDYPFPRARALALTASGGPRAAKRRLRYLMRLKAQARAVTRFVMSSPTR